VTRQKDDKRKMNEGRRKVGLQFTFIKQFVRCDCAASHWRGAEFEQLLGDHIDLHRDFIQTDIPLEPNIVTIIQVKRT
jgi:hypothetical protein